MTTVKKICSYKNCKSDSSNPSCKETFFSFPRDEERYKLWVTLSHCYDNDPNNIKFEIKSNKFLCSKHFDHKKYMSSNPRRKLLLSTAIPYKYDSDNDDTDCCNDTEDNNKNDENEYEITIESPVDLINETEENFEYGKIDDSDNIEYLENAWSNSPNNNFISSSSPVIIGEQQTIQVQRQQIHEDQRDVFVHEKITEKRSKQLQNYDKQYHQSSVSKRKLKEIKLPIRKKIQLVPNDEDNQQISTTSLGKNENILCQQEEEEEEDDEEDDDDHDLPHNSNNDDRNLIECYSDSNDNDDDDDDVSDYDNDDENNLILNPVIKTFMHKNEEYIGMPKSIYCKEKRQLLNEIKYYRNVITNLKKQIMNVKM